MRNFIIFALLLLFTQLFSTNLEATPLKKPMDVAVSLPPLSGLVQELGNDRVLVWTLLPAGQTPHTYSPTPKQIEKVLRSDVFFTLGMPFEKELIEKISASQKGPKIINLDQEPQHRNMEKEEPHSKSHDHGEDPHTWVSLKNISSYAKTISETLRQEQPERAPQIQEAEKQLLHRIQDLDTTFRNHFAKSQNKSIYVYHPAFGHFLEPYGISQKTIEQHGKKPTPRMLRNLIQKARRDQVGFIFAQPQIDQRVARSVAEAVGAKVVTIDPLSPNILRELEKLGREVKTALDGQK